MDQMYAMVCIVAILFIGDVVSIKTRAWVPSVFICAALFLIGFWTIFPKNIVEVAGIPTPAAILLMYLLIVNMGTLLSVKELIRQWKTVVIALAGIVGICIAVYLAGIALFDMNHIVVSIPPMAGGVVSSILMSKAASDAGLVDLSVLAIILYVMQGFAGYPLTSIVLKKEAKMVLGKYRQGQWEDTLAEESDTQTKEKDEDTPKLFKFMPKAYNTYYFKFLRIAIVGAIAYFCSTLLKPVVTVHPLVLCLLFGVIATSLGFLEKHSLEKANGFGFAVMGLMLFIFSPLSQATPDMLIRLCYPLVVFISVSVVGMYILSFIAGKLLGVSANMAFAISLTAFYGFPADYIITNEVINLMTQDEKERQVLNRHMLGPMLVGGFISVTIVSVILAGFFVGMLKG